MRILLDEMIVESEHINVRAGSPLWQGGGWFETIAVFENAVYNLPAHMKRLYTACPNSTRDSINWETVETKLRELAHGWLDRPGRLKLIVWSEEDRLRTSGWIKKYEPPPQDTYTNGITLETSEQSHPPRWPLSDQKRTCYKPVLERRQQSDYWDILYCDSNGNVWETSICNILWLNDNKIEAPTNDRNWLSGTVFDAILEQAGDLDLTVSRTTRKWSELGSFCWVTNSLVGMLPVRRINDHTFKFDSLPEPWVQLRERLLSDKVFPRWH